MAIRDARERLAREICWVEFACPEAVGKTKAAYWDGLPEQTRDAYRFRARELIFLTKLLEPRYVADVLAL
jgi:hypothetical protein